MKPILQLNESCPKTVPVAVHPETGDVWPERIQAIHDAEKSGTLARLLEITKATTFQEVAFIRQLPKPQGSLFDHVECHPETWEAMPQEQRELFTVALPADGSMLAPQVPPSHPPAPAE